MDNIPSGLHHTATALLGLNDGAELNHDSSARTLGAVDQNGGFGDPEFTTHAYHGDEEFVSNLLGGLHDAGASPAQGNAGATYAQPLVHQDEIVDIMDVGGHGSGDSRDISSYPGTSSHAAGEGNVNTMGFASQDLPMDGGAEAPNTARGEAPGDDQSEGDGDGVAIHGAEPTEDGPIHPAGGYTLEDPSEFFKQCSKCKVQVPSRLYYKNNRNKDHLQAWCKPCLDFYYRSRAQQGSKKTTPTGKRKRGRPRKMSFSDTDTDSEASEAFSADDGPDAEVQPSGSSLKRERYDTGLGPEPTNLGPKSSLLLFSPPFAEAENSSEESEDDVEPSDVWGWYGLPDRHSRMGHDWHFRDNGIAYPPQPDGFPFGMPPPGYPFADPASPQLQPLQSKSPLPMATVIASATVTVSTTVSGSIAAPIVATRSDPVSSVEPLSSSPADIPVKGEGDAATRGDAAPAHPSGPDSKKEKLGDEAVSDDEDKTDSETDVESNEDAPRVRVAPDPSNMPSTPPPAPFLGTAALPDLALPTLTAEEQQVFGQRGMTLIDKLEGIPYGTMKKSDLRDCCNRVLRMRDRIAAALPT